MGKKVFTYDPDIIHIWFKEGTTFDTLLEDGIIRRFDIITLADEYPIFNKLLDRKLFLKGKNMVSGIFWTHEIDVSSWAIFDYGIDVTNEYDDYQRYLIGYRLKMVRQKKKISQEELEKRAGIDQATLSKIEKGHMNVSIKTIERISKALNAKINISIK